MRNDSDFTAEKISVVEVSGVEYVITGELALIYPRSFMTEFFNFLVEKEAQGLFHATGLIVKREYIVTFVEKKGGFATEANIH